MKCFLTVYNGASSKDASIRKTLCNRFLKNLECLKKVNLLQDFCGVAADLLFDNGYAVFFKILHGLALVSNYL